MKLPRPRPTYDSHDEAQARAQIEQADAQNFKRGQDVEIAGKANLILADGVALILVDTATKERMQVSVKWGAVVVTPLDP